MDGTRAIEIEACRMRTLKRRERMVTLFFSFHQIAFRYTPGIGLTPALISLFYKLSVG